MDAPMCLRPLAFGLLAAVLALVPPAPARGQILELGHVVGDHVEQWTGFETDVPPPTTIRQLAWLVDHLDKKLYHYGKIAVQSPSVFGQNRMTGYRRDYDAQMKTRFGSFEVILSAYQRRSDSAALSSATTIAAAVQPGASPAARPAMGGGASTTVVVPAATPAAGSAGAGQAATPAPIPIPSITTPAGYVNAGTLVGSANGDLMPGALSDLAIANAGSPKGIGLEPNQALDEESDYLHHLNELRRINAGDDSSDLPGYGLYLIRVPISLLPSRESSHGKGASVTFKAKHNVTPDALPNTFSNVVTLDTAYTLLDTIVRGQFFKIVDETPATPATGPQRTTGGRPRSGQSSTFQNRPAAVMGPAGVSGGTHGANGNAPSTEVVPLFGADNLMVLVEALHDDQATWYRHDPSVASWLLRELGSAYTYMREQAHRNNPLFQPAEFESIAALVLDRRYVDLKAYRDNWIKSLRESRGVDARMGGDGKPLFKPEPLDVLSFALIVQSVFLDRQIKYDMEIMSQRKGCACGDPWGLSFYDLYPTAPEDVERYNRARAAFAAYVECKWPIHIFSVDPSIDQQNELDLFSQRTQLQLALAVAVASGSVNFQNATSYARRTELDLATVALNRTIIGFGAGDTTFGWQFYPRIQTPPLQSNPRRIAGILINNGPGPDYALEQSRIEPGPRECYALVVMPTFVPSIKFTSVTNWFDLKTKHAEQVLETTDMVRLGKKLQAAKHGLQHVCDTGVYRPEEVELLADRIGQLEDMLPVKSHSIALPFEGSLLGSEIFSSNAAGLAPRLLAWYGEPPQEAADSSIFILGNGFCVNELHVVAGGVNLPDGNFDVISRNVLRVTIPAVARPVQTSLVIDGVKRKLMDVHVASPNGISNHLLVEVQAASAAASAAPSPAYTLSSDTNTLKVKYALLETNDGRHYPAFVGTDPGELDLTWNDAIGIAGSQVVARFNFPDPAGVDPNASEITIPSNSTLTLTCDGGNKNYPITGDPLDGLGRDLVRAYKDQLSDPTKAAPSPKTSKITLTPRLDANSPLVTQGEAANGPLTVIFVKTEPSAPKISLKPPGTTKSSAVTYTLDPTNTRGGVAQDVTIDWLAKATDVQTSMAIGLTAGGKPIGSLYFKFGEVSSPPRTIPAPLFKTRLDEFVATLKKNGGVDPQPGDVYTASSLDLVPRTADGTVYQLPSGHVDNPPFEIDWTKAQTTGAGRGAYLAPRAGFPTARRVAPPASAPAQAPAVARGPAPGVTARPAAAPPSRRDDALRRTGAPRAASGPPDLLPLLPAPTADGPPATKAAGRPSLLKRLMPGSR